MMTHRVFSRNAASSRAIPFKKMVKDVMDNPAMPERWGAEQRGMQSADRTIGKAHCEDIWMAARNAAEACASTLHMQDLHKSLCNRLLEPFAHITVLATATDAGLANFFALRAHPAAQPEFQVLAYRMLARYIMEAELREVEWGQWHIPHFDNTPDYANDGLSCVDGTMLKVATARCARLSYLTFDGEHSLEKDIELHDRLVRDRHWSPFEHCAQAVEGEHAESNFDVEEWSHWQQYRKQFSNENKTKINLQMCLDAKPDWITL